MRALAIVVAAVALAACVPPPKQNGGLRPIDQRGLALRMRIMCRLGLGGDDLAQACVAPKAEPGVIGRGREPESDGVGDSAAKACDGSPESCSGPHRGRKEPEGVGTSEAEQRLTR